MSISFFCCAQNRLKSQWTKCSRQSRLQLDPQLSAQPNPPGCAATVVAYGGPGYKRTRRPQNLHKAYKRLQMSWPGGAPYWRRQRQQRRWRRALELHRGGMANRGVFGAAAQHRRGGLVRLGQALAPAKLLVLVRGQEHCSLWHTLRSNGLARCWRRRRECSCPWKTTIRRVFLMDATGNCTWCQAKWCVLITVQCAAASSVWWPKPTSPALLHVPCVKSTCEMSLYPCARPVRLGLVDFALGANNPIHQRAACCAGSAFSRCWPLEGGVASIAV